MNYCSAADHIVFHIDFYLAVFVRCHIGQQVTQVGAVELTGLSRQPARQIGIANESHPMFDHDPTGFGQGTVTSLFSRQIDNDTAIAH